MSNSENQLVSLLVLTKSNIWNKYCTIHFKQQVSHTALGTFFTYCNFWSPVQFGGKRMRVENQLCITVIMWPDKVCYQYKIFITSLQITILPLIQENCQLSFYFLIRLSEIMRKGIICQTVGVPYAPNPPNSWHKRCSLTYGVILDK